MQNLKRLSNDVLLIDLKNLVSKERSLIVQVLGYLREVEVRKLHLARGYSSMFAFCTEGLGYSEAEAHIRIQAMRLAKEVPEVTKNIEEGKLSLSVAAMAQNQFRKTDLQRKSEGQTKISLVEKFQVLKELQSCSKKEATHKLSQHFSLPQQIKLSFEASPKLCEKLEKLKGLLAHKNFGGDLAKLIETMADICIENLETKTRGIADSHERAIISNQTEITLPDKVHLRHKKSRYIPLTTRRKVWRESDGKCQFIDLQTGRKCESPYALQIDHIHEFAKGGGHSVENLRLLCANHNRFKNDQQKENRS